LADLRGQGRIRITGEYFQCGILLRHVFLASTDYALYLTWKQT
jgi:hypothetical protein